MKAGISPWEFFYYTLIACNLAKITLRIPPAAQHPQHSMLSPRFTRPLVGTTIIRPWREESGVANSSPGAIRGSLFSIGYHGEELSEDDVPKYIVHLL